LAYISAAESIRVSSNNFTQSVQKATKFGEIKQPLGLLRRSRSFKVADFCTNRKRIILRLPISDYIAILDLSNAISRKRCKTGGKLLLISD